MAAKRIRDGVQGSVELGPRSLALLRRICRALEMLVDEQVPDPGKQSEQDDSADWPDA